MSHVFITQKSDEGETKMEAGAETIVPINPSTHYKYAHATQYNDVVRDNYKLTWPTIFTHCINCNNCKKYFYFY